MKSTMKMAEGLAVGMVIGGAVWAVLSSKMARPDAKKKMRTAVKSACQFIEGICS